MTRNILLSSLPQETLTHQARWFWCRAAAQLHRPLEGNISLKPGLSQLQRCDSR